MRTAYTGVKAELINSGLATPGMFETTQGRQRRSGLCRKYHAEQGDWQIRLDGRQRNRQELWEVIYLHPIFKPRT